MSKALLEIQNLHVRVEEMEILHGVDLAVGQDETHVLMGPNGTGKSTLGYAITGNPTYSVTGGSIIFNGEDITERPVNERAKKGIFLSFQNPLEVPGVTLSAFIRSALEQKTGDRLRLWDFKKKLKETMALLNMDESYAERDLNVASPAARRKRPKFCRCSCSSPSSRFSMRPTPASTSTQSAPSARACACSASGRTARFSSSPTPRAFWKRSMWTRPT